MDKLNHKSNNRLPSNKLNSVTTKSTSTNMPVPPKKPTTQPPTQLTNQNNQPNNKTKSIDEENREKLFGKNKIDNKTETKTEDKTDEEFVSEQEKELKKQNDMLLASLGLAYESNQIGRETMDELKRNRESINRSKDLANSVSNHTDNASKSLGNMERRRRFFGMLDMFNSKN